MKTLLLPESDSAVVKSWIGCRTTDCLPTLQAWDRWTGGQRPPRLVEACLPFQGAPPAPASSTCGATPSSRRLRTSIIRASTPPDQLKVKVGLDQTHSYLLTPLFSKSTSSDIFTYQEVWALNCNITPQHLLDIKRSDESTFNRHHIFIPKFPEAFLSHDMFCAQFY